MISALVDAFVVQTAATQNAPPPTPPPTPGAVVAPIDRPVIQPETTPEATIEELEYDGFKPPASSKKIKVDRFILSGNSLFDDPVPYFSGECE